jgi:hypothetical protein
METGQHKRNEERIGIPADPYDVIFEAGVKV